MIRVLLMWLLLWIASSCAAKGQETTPDDQGLTSRISQVTLYRDRAMVTREIRVPAGEPLRSIEVDDLPELLVADSVFADGAEGTIVRGVRVSAVPVSQAHRDVVAQLNRQIADLERQQAEVEQMLNVIDKDSTALEKLVDFSAQKGSSDLNRGVLNAETLTTLTTFSMTQRRELAMRQLDYQNQLTELNQKLDLATQEHAQATTTEQSQVYQVRVFVETANDAAGLVHLNYMVGGCSWSPQYTVRGQIGRSDYELRYSAAVQQMSGEDWNAVALVLSTASPTVDAARPLLMPLRIVTVDQARVPSDASAAAGEDKLFGDAPSGDPQEEFAQAIQLLRLQQKDAESQFNDRLSAIGARERDLALNSFAGRLQQIEMQAESDSWQALAPDRDDDISSQVYSLDQAVSLQTRREHQLVQIAAIELPGEMIHVATPLLSTFAFREAEITNTQPFGLLGGPAAVYLDDRFVGRTELPSTASGQKLTVGFGADQQVRTRRELTRKQDAVQGGNRQLTFQHRLVIANFKDREVQVRLLDRIPVTRQQSKLSITLDTPAHPVSDDALYQRVLRPHGILRWDVPVPANRHGSQAFDVTYSYTMAFDRNQVPATPDMLSQMQADYHNLQLPAGGMGGMGGAIGGSAGGQ